MRQNKQRKLHRDILFILISSFIVVIAWIGFNIYHIYITSTISEDVQAQLSPIDGTFDTNTINSLKSRTRVNPEFDAQSTASPSAPTTAPTPSLEEASEPEATLDTAPLATESSRFAPTDTPINRVGQ
jgi:hypothetical protein